MTDPKRNPMPAPYRAAAAMFCTVLLAVLLGCGGGPETPEEEMTALAERIAAKVRDGWQVGRVRDMVRAMGANLYNTVAPVVQAPLRVVLSIQTRRKNRRNGPGR